MSDVCEGILHCRVNNGDKNINSLPLLTTSNNVNREMYSQIHLSCSMRDLGNEIVIHEFRYILII